MWVRYRVGLEGVRSLVREVRVRRRLFLWVVEVIVVEAIEVWTDFIFRI